MGEQALEGHWVSFGSRIVAGGLLLLLVAGCLRGQPLCAAGGSWWYIVVPTPTGNGLWL
jgi:hypothetical protein